MKKTIYIIAVLGLLLAMVQCGKKSSKKAEGKAEVAESNANLDALLNPSDEDFSKPAPNLFKVVFETSKGTFTMEVHRDWSPHGVDRFYYLAKNGYYNGVRFFRVVPGFVAQFGMHGNPQVTQTWATRTIPDDPVVQSNLRGYVSYAKTNAPDSRSTQLFINYKDNSFLDDMGFSPIGKIVEGMEVVDQLYGGYGDGPPRGLGPSQAKIREQGNEYLIAEFPQLDYIKSTKIVVE